MSGVTSIEDLKRKLGETAGELSFHEEADIIVCKPKEYIEDKHKFRALAEFMEDLGGPYRPGKGFVFRKVSPVAIPGPPSRMAKRETFRRRTGKPLTAVTSSSKGLGREASAEKPSRRFEMIPVRAILSMPFQSRLAAPSEEELNELISSFRSHGILMPVLVRPTPDGLYELVAGGRRLTAAKKADFEVIPAIVREMTDQQAYEAHLIENLQRKDLTDYEKARMLDYLLKRFPESYPTQTALARKIGKSEGWVRHHLKMLELDQIVPGYDFTKITEHQAREILAAPPEKRGEIVERIKEGEVPSVREIRKLVKPPEEAEKPEEVTEKGPKRFVAPGLYLGEWVTCSRCRVATREPLEWRGKPVCATCYEQLSKPETEPSTPSSVEEPPKPKPQPLLTGFQVECPECHQALLIDHREFPDGKTEHKLKEVS